MPRDPLAWLPLLRHWTHCLGEGPEAMARMGDLAALPELNLAALLPGGPGWTDVQRCLRHDPEEVFASITTAWPCGAWRRCRRRSSWWRPTARRHRRSAC